MHGAEVGNDELTRDRPCARQPCLNRIVAECLDANPILRRADGYGLLTASIPRSPAPGEIVRADALPPEPVEIWRKEIRTLRACADLWDAITAGDEGLGSTRTEVERALGPRAVPPELAMGASHSTIRPRRYGLRPGSASPPKPPVSFNASAARPQTATAGSSGKAPLQAASSSAPMLAKTGCFDGKVN